VGLFLLYGNFMEGSKLEPILATASFGVLVGMLLAIYMVSRPQRRQRNNLDGNAAHLDRDGRFGGLTAPAGSDADTATTQ
jgi:hypothetical protein